ncbi:MAG: AAA family ATPase, partial [Planctomycetota bacterium]|nr:AAA family ATPase [Planctomycetota bacterium]
MNPRIERIKVKRGGPLENDFEIQPGDLNLVYGLNETGKTFLVESMVRLLFKTQGRDAPAWKLREWDTNGKILVSGIEEEGQVTSFGKTSKKLEDYRSEEDDHLPGDFSRLLVVRAGETVLSGDPGEDGISRDILKDYLSEERLLDELLEGISITIQGAQVTEKAIIGDNRGEVRTQKGLKNEVNAFNELLEDVKQNFSEGPVSILRKKLTAMEEMCEDLGRAKRHQAYLLRSNHKDLEEKKSALEGLEVLGEMESSIEQYDGKVSEGALLEKEVKELQEAVGKRQWCEEALKNYEEIINRRSVKGPEKAWRIGAAVALIAAVACGFLGQNWLLGAGAVLSLVCGWMFSRKLSAAAPVAASDNVELKRMDQQYQENFGKALGDRASLTERIGSLQEDLGRARARQEQLDQSNSAAGELRARIDGFFLQAGFDDLDSGDWRKTLAEMHASHRAVEGKINDCEKKLRNLLVPEEEDLEEDPGTAWDPGRFDELTTGVEQLETEIEVEDGRLGDLKERVAAQAGLRVSTGWDVLLESHQQQKESKLREYTECTSYI